MLIVNYMESDTMKKILIIPNQFKDKEFKVTLKVTNWLLQHECQVFLPKELEKVEYLKGHAFANESDLLVMDYGLVLGGDGTIIQSSRTYIDYDLPLLGINLGNLGFLAEIELIDLEKALESFINGEFIIEERMMIYAKHYNEELNEPSRSFGTALNDIVISRQSISRMISFDVFVNNAFVNSYRADGVIISTPTGSTAYNLSAGGPIISPNNEIIVMTPICPHSLTARSIVLSGSDEIKITFKHARNKHVDDLLVTIDGQEATRIYKQDTIIIRKASQKVRLMRLTKNDFFEILRRKLS